MKNTAVKAIIHGHFYQPPREDPWTDNIEPQPTAYPHKNWNLRITSECYAPNCFSRVLDNRGRIKDIINNYRYISFNFGPTLLSWLEKKDKEVYDLIIEADKDSINEHNGHGNAIAQIYNHVIMPLQSYEDKKTEIFWGLRDFEHRFNRKSEGMWLSETAVDYETIDLLIYFGIKYIILSPEQADSFRKIGKKDWTHVSSSSISTRFPYKIIRDHGEIAVFYFDKRLSTAVSFKHLLHNSDDFALRIKQSVGKKNDVVIIASDGEIFGHHEPFGDMCLASLIKEYHIEQKQIQLMNFGEYLELQPPEYETKISLGDEGLGSSWSCFHGVGRWYKDCGCHTGGQEGWNQQWRTPFRDSLNIVKESLDKLFLEKISSFLEYPWELRNKYIECILDSDNITRFDFIRRNLNSDISDGECKYILALLEAQKYGLLMYTSCAWFFSDISGIETVQNIKYAYKAISLISEFDKDVKNKFEDKIKEARSNIKENQDGKWILNNWVYPYLQDFPHIANNFIFILKAGENKESFFNVYKTFGFDNYIINKINEINNNYEGKIRIYEKHGYKSKEYYFIFLEKEEKNENIIVSIEEDELFKRVKDEVINSDFKIESYINSSVRHYSETDLISEVKDYIIKNKYKNQTKELVDYSIKYFGESKNLLSKYKNMNIKLPEIFKYFLRFTTQAISYNLSLSVDTFPSKEILIALIQIFGFLKDFSIDVDINNLKNKLSLILYNNIKLIGNDLDSKVFRQSVILLEFCDKIECVLEKSRSENIVFKLLKDNANELMNKIDNLKEEDRAKYIVQFRNLVILADNFNINTESEKKEFFKHFKNVKETMAFDKHKF